jgi:hypothetical protein
MNKGKNIFAQIMSLVNEYDFKRCVDRYKGDRHSIKFKACDQFMVMSFAQFTVTRSKDNMVYDVLDTRLEDKCSGILSDEIIRLTGYFSSRKYPDAMRLVVYEDYETGNVYQFLTNNFAIEDPLTIAELYRERWQIKLFFKWIKQHLHIKAFYGTSQNAIYTQIRIAICDYLLLIIAKKRFDIDQSLHTISRSIGSILFARESLHDI